MPGSGSQLVIVADGHGWHVCDLLRAAEQAAVPTALVSFRHLSWQCNGDGRCVAFGQPMAGPPAQLASSHREPICLYDSAGGAERAVLVRCVPPGSLEQIVFRLDVLHILDRSGVPVINPPRALELAIDKTLSLALLRQAGLPTPATAVAENRADGMVAFERLGGQAVVKPIFGSEGKGVYRVDDREQAWQAFALLERLGSVIYLQEYIDDVEADIRALVLAGELIAAVRRRHPNDWRRNAARGAAVTACRLDPTAADLAVRAAAVLGTEFAGVDLLFSRSRGHLLLEVNAVPGWRATRRATGLDVAGLLVRHALDRLNRR